GGILCSGGKKCMPTIRSGERASRAISAVGRAEVFDAITASGRRTCSSSPMTRRLVAMSSNTASITRSAVRNPARSGPPVTRPIMRAASRRSNTPFFAASVVSSRIVERPFATAAASRSRARTRRPDEAAACAMPEPMKPRPTTPTFAIERGLEEDCRMNDLVDHARAERAFWRELPRREDHVERARKADEARQPLRTAGGRDEAEARLGQAEADVGRIRGDPRVARERDLESASERRAVYRGDRDERERREVVEHSLHRPAL